MRRFIGDVHGKFHQYEKICSEVSYPTIQVGDFGAGFRPLPDMPEKDRFIRGNHDSPEVCKNSSRWIPDGHYEANTHTLYIGGALSIDAHLRVEGVSWWRDEEINMSKFQEIIDLASDLKPRVIVSHDAPETAILRLMHFYSGGPNDHPSITRQALEQLFQHHQPEIWVFGHWHRPADLVIDGTRFICLPELAYIDLDI